MEPELILGLAILVLIAYLYFTKNSNQDLHTVDEMGSLKSQLSNLNRRLANVEKMVKMETTNIARERKHVHDTLALQSEQRRFDNIQLSGIIDRHTRLDGNTDPKAH